MKIANLKPWQKVAIGIVTIGITGTTIYYSAIGIKKLIAKRNSNKLKKLEETKQTGSK